MTIILSKNKTIFLFKWIKKMSESNLKKVSFFDHDCSDDDEEINLLKNSKNVIHQLKFANQYQC